FRAVTLASNDASGRCRTSPVRRFHFRHSSGSLAVALGEARGHFRFQVFEQLPARDADDSTSAISSRLALKDDRADFFRFNESPHGWLVQMQNPSHIRNTVDRIERDNFADNLALAFLCSSTVADLPRLFGRRPPLIVARIFLRNGRLLGR